MIRHIVMWKLKDYQEETMLEIRTRLTSLVGVVPEIQSTFEVVFAEKDYALANGGYHLALIADFESVDALKGYQGNPDHKAVSAFVRSQIAERACLDYPL